MQICYRVFSTASGKSLILAIGPRKYAFNVFEGFQRYCIERQFSMCSLDVVCLPDQYSVPGLVGAYLSMGSTTKELLTVVTDGAVDLDSIHRFALPQGVRLEQMQSYRDESVGIVAVKADGVNNYYVELAPINGQFYPERVPAEIPKRFYRQLNAGKTIVHNGCEYHGTDYGDPPLDLGLVIVIFSADGFESITRLAEARMIFCMTIEAAIFCTRFVGSTKVYYVRDSRTVEYTEFYDMQCKLNQEDGSFLLPWAPQDESWTQSMDEAGLFRVYKAAKSINQRYTAELELLKGFNGEELETGDIIEFHKLKGFSLIKQTPVLYNHTSTPPPVRGLTFLGTGCSVPSVYRNVSAILYETENDAILMDCGEDTLAQLMRARGCLDALAKLRIIYLSHSHADHMLGVASILRMLDHPITIVGPSACRQFIESYYCNDLAHDYFETCEAKVLEDALHARNIRIRHRGWLKYSTGEIDGFLKSETAREASVIATIGQFKLHICGCLHSTDSTSIVIEDLANTRTIAYSGDTSPSLLFTAMARGADYLIHEASFIDAHHEFAVRTNHSCEREARLVFEYSGSKRLFLTHFSNRTSALQRGESYVTDLYIYEIK